MLSIAKLTRRAPPDELVRSTIFSRNRDYSERRHAGILATLSRAAHRCEIFGEKKLPPLVRQRLASFPAFQIHRQTQLVSPRGRSLPRRRKIQRQYLPLGMDWHA